MKSPYLKILFLIIAFVAFHQVGLLYGAIITVALLVIWLAIDKFRKQP